MNLKPRILLVDDDTTALGLMCEILSEKDYRVDTSSSVDEAVEGLKSQHYHALITDLKMPGKTGIELLDYVVNTYPDIPVIMLTAYGTIPENLIESELFGYEKGAFTDAKVRTKGKLEIADGGTLFMDEINELPAKAQVALLRFLQDPEITPLGSPRRIALNVRVLVATNKDLKRLVRDRQFREDLYYRINVLPITLPPLRERREDIIPMAVWFLKRFCQEYNRRIFGFTREAERRLISYFWPGNIRELRNCIERAVIISRGTEIGPESLYLDTEDGNACDFSEVGIVPLKELQQRYIHWVLDSLGGNKTMKASRLGISVRGLRYKLHNEEAAD